MADAGLAAERTFLAWQRSALAVVLGSAVAARYFLHMVNGPMPALLAIAGGTLGLVALLWIRRRYSVAVAELLRNQRLPRFSAAPLALVAGAVSMCAVAAGVFVFLMR
ncbi:DUF202 domain-containing protein [Jonesia quinghaiensis]|uniref:DUF202 domain-containing protein n=1 Tax=Jonesia quinghaiensis TaxID=262806 RepID=UPI00042A1880|nr:DUF202 domain-containing protein [Jonesia quinghaiensis]